MKANLREQATQLRLEGWSYNIIRDRLGVAKSTLSNWLKNIPSSPNAEVIKRIKAGPAKSGALRHDQRIKSIENANKLALKDIGKITERDLFMIGLGVYMGEGSKLYEQIQIINSNPDVLRLSMRWFRETCGIPLKNFTSMVHIYPDVNEKEAINYWSSITGIPPEQFGKTQVDIRTNKSAKKHRLLPYGTAHIRVKACGNPQYGVLLHRRIIGWIEAVYNNAGVV